MTQDKHAEGLRALDQWSAKVTGYQANATRALARSVGEFWSSALARSGELSRNPITPQEWLEYQTDLWQRWVIALDVLRKRGNQYFEHEAAGKPPVLVYKYEMLVDGRKLARPVNYALLRIIPPEGVSLDPDKRPFVIVDPRAGHGPGIGGFKEDSEVGEALRAGHAVYFVSFFPDPEPGQRLIDVAAAEEVFLEEVAKRHPAAGKPVVMGNCQGGWAVMALAAARPGLTGPIVMNGSPLSYWSGASGKNPMRYSGGMLGGTWMAQLAADLGNGKFDGAYLVQNFENLNLANTYWSKVYNLFRNADTEELRFLEFERWWGGHYNMNAEEIRAIVEELFVGNRLAAGEIMTPGGQALDLRAIKAPIVVFASEGDNITPPEQALNWIVDLYPSTGDLVANKQTIVYLKHLSIGHLGIFVSAKVAVKEHRQIVSLVEHIEDLPPGLYEMILTNRGTKERPEYEVKLENREIADILAADADRRADEAEFQTVANVSAINSGLYDAFVGPLVRASSNQTTAQAIRMMQPARSVHYWFSDRNPWLRAMGGVADAARATRQPAKRDNPFNAWEKAFSDSVTAILDGMTAARDNATETMFYATYGWLRALGLGQTYRGAAEQAKEKEKTADEAKVSSILTRIDQGGIVEALVRSFVIAQRAQGYLRPDRTTVLLERLHDQPEFASLSPEEIRRIVYEQTVSVAYEPERAEQTIPALVPTAAEQRRAHDIVLKVLEGADLDPRLVEALQRIGAQLHSESTEATAAPASEPSRKRRAVTTSPSH